MTDDTLSLYASHLTASAKSRTIAGTIVAYGVVGNTSRGPTIFEAGSIEVPADLGRVKLLVQHDTYSAAVGLLAEFSAAAGTGSFSVPEGAEGDDALDKAAKGLRDGLSVGVQILSYSYDADDNLVVHAARLTEVSLVTIPAYDDARVFDVAANRKDSTMTAKTTPTAAPVAPVTPADPIEATAAAVTPEPIERAEPVTIEAQAGSPVRPSTDRKPLDLRAAAVLFADGVRAEKSAQSLAAALNDIIPANDAGKGFLRDGWAGQVWQAARTNRPLIDALGTPRPLRNRKITGWKRDVDKLAEVDPYNGNKEAIPSGDVATVPVEANAVRFAGGWDFDRIYVDLGDPDFVEETVQQAVEDYKRKSEAYVRAQLLAGASTVVAQATLTKALATLGLAAVQLGSDLSFVTLAPDVWAAFAELPAADVPWWLQRQGQLNLGTTTGEAGSIKFSTGPDIPAGTILAGDSRAATYYEVDPPIRATALNIPNGGVDLGVFGYAGLLINDARAIFKTTITPAP